MALPFRVETEHYPVKRLLVETKAYEGRMRQSAEVEVGEADDGV